VGAMLAERMGIPHTQLDSIFHQPGWTKLDNDEFRSRVRAKADESAWVIDGNNQFGIDVVWERADTVVWLDRSKWVVTRRLVVRTLSRVIHRTELWNGNRQTLTNLVTRPHRSIVVFALRRHGEFQRRYSAAMVDPRWSHLTFIRLASGEQIDAFMHGMSPACLDEGAN
jgi:hypothetical protein